MKKTITLILLICNIFIFSQITKSYDIDGVSRKAIIYNSDKKSGKLPVVFVFHGHGGNADFARRRINIQDYYKEAVVVFMEGLPGRKVPGIDPNGTMNGWQIFADDLESRDLKFFDKILTELHMDNMIDDSRIYLVGHSNGARFVNVLWKERGNKITAICSASAQGGKLISGAVPISVWMYMGKDDKIVSFESQNNSVPIVKANLRITADGKTDHEKMIFEGTDQTELVVQQSNAGHEFPRQSLPEIVAFFKRHSK